MRVATIDIGTNSVLLLIAEAKSNRSFGLQAIHESSTITRLGQGVDQTGKLHPRAVERTLDCLKHYANLIDGHDVQQVEAVTTSATRDAVGTESFLDSAQMILGCRPRVISGQQEARLTFQGAMSGLPIQKAIGIFDIGGGSTEVVLGQASSPDTTEVETATSLDMGCVRMTERHIFTDPPLFSELQAVRTAADSLLGTLPRPHRHRTWIGIGGTVTSLVTISQRMQVYDSAKVHGARLTHQDISRLVDRLSSMPLSDRQGVVGLNPKRADVILTGACLVQRTLAWTGQHSLLVSDRGVRWGLAIEKIGTTLPK